jgi:hypothetical protein
VEQEVGGSSPPNCTSLCPFLIPTRNLTQHWSREVRLTANLLPLAISESIANARLPALPGADRWHGRWIDRRYRRGHHRTDRRRTNRRQVDRALAKRLHLAVDALANARRRGALGADRKENNCADHRPHSTIHESSRQPIAGEIPQQSATGRKPSFPSAFARLLAVFPFPTSNLTQPLGPRPLAIPSRFTHNSGG